MEILLLSRQVLKLDQGSANIDIETFKRRVNRLAEASLKEYMWLGQTVDEEGNLVGDREDVGQDVSQFQGVVSQFQR